MFLLNWYFQLWLHFEVFFTAYVPELLWEGWFISIVLQHTELKNWKPNPKNAVHYKQETELGTDKGLNCCLQLIANLGLR